MKTFTKVCLILSGTLAGVGVIFCIIGGAMGASFGKIGNVSRTNWGIGWLDTIGDWFDWDEDDFEAFEDYLSEDSSVTSIENSDGATTYVYAADEIKNIRNLDIDIKAGTLKILESEDEQIHLLVDANGGSVKQGINGSTFTVKDTTRGLFGGWGIFGWRDKGVKVVLYLPEDMNFDQLEIDVSAGEVDTTGSELTAKEADLSVDAGSLRVGVLNVSQKLEADTGAGEVRIGELTAEEVELDCGVGEMDIQGTISGNIKADCGVGELHITLNGEEESFNYVLDCGIGDVKIGNSSYTSLGKKKEIDNNAEKTMNLDCGVGSIKVKYE